MNSTLAHPYSEPYRLPAGVLALAVHAGFFALIYFGISWRAEPPQGMVVDIWESLPQAEVTPEKVVPPPVEPVEPPKPADPPKPVEPEKPIAPPKAEIELAEKKKPKIKPAEIKKPAETRKQTEQKRIEEERAAQAEQAARAEQAERERARAEQAAAIGKVVDEHKARIIAKIRRNIVMPPDVPDNARAEFEVTLLPGGAVLSAKLVQPSGKDAYDSAVERAILKSAPLPLPADVALFNKFRELRLKFSPKE